MTKKQFQDKLKSQKGITAADALIALLIILASISIIGMIYLNINTITAITNAKTGATRIATNIIENVKGAHYDRIDNFDSRQPGAEQTIFNTKIPKGYSVIITTENFEQDNNNVAKKVNVKVIYNKNNDNDAVELSTIIEREKVRECNSPKFTEEYVNDMVGDGNEYQLYQSLLDIEGNKKIICPIKFNGENYVIVTGNNINDMWYSYSDKQWARVLVFDDSDDLQKYIDTTSNMVTNLEILKDTDKSFIWVPRFKIDKTVSPNQVYFIYKNTNYAILQSTGNKVYNYINVSDEQLNNRLEGITEQEGVSPKVGLWVSYNTMVEQTDSVLNEFFNSKYGPLFEI